MSKKPTNSDPAASKPKIAPPGSASSRSTKTDQLKTEPPRAQSAKTVSNLKPAESKATETTETNLKDMVGLITGDESNTCFVVLDETTRVSAFLRHRDVSYINCLELQPNDSEKIRLGLIAAIRFGKSLVFDLVESENLIENVQNICSGLDPNLFEEMRNKSIVKEERYMKYVKKTDGEIYDNFNFVDENMKKYNVVFLLGKNTASDNFLKLGKPYKIA